MRTMTMIAGRGEERLKGKNLAHVARFRSDGWIQSAPVWIDVQDGLPTVNSAEGRAWPRNLERDPRATLTVQNMENPYEYVEIRGRVAERTHEGANEHIVGLAIRIALDAQVLLRQRVIIRFAPEHVYVSAH